MKVILAIAMFLVGLGGCASRNDNVSHPAPAGMHWDHRRHEWVDNRYRLSSYHPAVDKNQDGTVGFTDLQDTQRPSVQREPWIDPSVELESHLRRQDPKWKEEHRDELPR